MFDKKWKNPVILGAAIYSHPVDHPDLFNKYPQVKRVLVPGEWICDMFKPYYGDKVIAWPVGTDTTDWQPSDHAPKYDFLVYNKLPNSPYQSVLLKPILELLAKRALSYQIVTYGSYDQQELKEKLSQCRGAIFLSRSETQGLAYQQILATDTPILAWDREGFWEDPEYYPHRVQYQPVSSVPYWDKRCGVKFSGPDDLEAQLDLFLKKIQDFKPREYILENLTLEHCAQKYVQIYKEVLKELT
ncbi:glycosyltransferase [Mucilaginibacter conchicola]|uniref:glycosyltransferase n=1 Tax=Mucilaginibacter conchicola TaxID=2303333 RepID=UPI0011C1CEAC|nr:glycosyltransferase [Mucilaginibacter conchicola]